MLLVTDVPSGAVLHALETMRFLAIQLAVGQRSIFDMVDFRLLVFEPVSFVRRDRSVLDTLVDPRFLPVLSLIHPLFHSFRRGCLCHRRGRDNGEERECSGKRDEFHDVSPVAQRKRNASAVQVERSIQSVSYAKML
jgi:hypothetical protein